VTEYFKGRSEEQGGLARARNRRRTLDGAARRGAEQGAAGAASGASEKHRGDDPVSALSSSQRITLTSEGMQGA
jgi:hypothetical protein